MSGGSTRSGDARHVVFFDQEAIKPFVVNDLTVMLKQPIRFIPPHGGKPALGYPATILADICESVLAARQAGAISATNPIARECEVLVRGFARVGIIALVDEATGYQKDRARDALAKILEAFVAWLASRVLLERVGMGRHPTRARRTGQDRAISN